MRHTRIVATVRTLLRLSRGARRPHSRGRRCLPAEFFPRDARHSQGRVRPDPTGRRARRPRRRDSPGFVGPEDSYRHAAGRQAHSVAAGRHPATDDRRRGGTAGAGLHDLRAAGDQREARPGAAPRRRTDQPQGRVDGRHDDRHDRHPWRVAWAAQGHQRARRGVAGRGADAEGRGRPALRALARGGHGGAVVRAIGRRHPGRAPRHRRGRRVGHVRSSRSWSGRKASRISTQCSSRPTR